MVETHCNGVYYIPIIIQGACFNLLKKVIHLELSRVQPYTEIKMHGFIHLNQTNFSAFNLMTLFKHIDVTQIRANLFLTVLLVITVFISACSTQPITKTKKNISTKTITKKINKAKTAEEKLSLAQSLNVKNINTEQRSFEQQLEITELLVEASELFLQQQNFSKSLWLAHETFKLAQNNYKNTYRLLLVKAASLQALNYHQQAQQQLQLANELVLTSQKNKTISPIALTLDYYQILNKTLITQGKFIPALNAQLNAFALNDNASNKDVMALWKQLEKLSQWQIMQLVNNKPPYMDGWQQLLNYSHRFGANKQQFSRYLSLWQQHNPTHPALSIIEQLQAIDLTPSKIENIAIFLPLSGSQQKAGLAAQQGILAAYKNNTTTSIHFIDTNKVNWDNIVEHFNTLNIDHIIGPLLKSNVETFLKLSSQQVTLQVPTLLLNLPYQHKLTKNQVALSMRPEDEAIQAAATLSQKRYNKPIVLSHQDRVSKRIALAFSQRWQLSNGNPVEIVYFNEGKQMQDSLKESLDINKSKARIKQLNGRLQNTIKSEPRNRRDIDMIYLVGTAAQTRLIKPYIDVNTSPFADVIPVYASSRSHSHFNDKSNTNNSNDLQGLTFTQIPWLLDSKQKSRTLAKLSDTLWPKRTDSLSKIFAMGFDSYNLLGKVSLMKKAPYIRHFGQTGRLKLNNENILIRSLLWGQYKNNKVSQVVMD